MVNDPLTSAVALARRSPYNSPVRGDAMAKPLVTRQDSMRQETMRQDSDAHALIAPAVRTLEADRADLRLEYFGTPEELQRTLAQAGLVLDKDANKWRLQVR